MTTTVHFIHTGDAYLPELAAYQAYLQSQGAQGVLHRSASTVPSDAQFVWWMCGRVPRADAARFSSAQQVHEYASASVPPWAGPKDLLKRWTQPRPHYRVYQNDWVRQRLGFADDVPYTLRDMGIPDAMLQTGSESPPLPTHDFVYLGEMRRLSGFMPVIDAIAQAEKRLLLIGQLPPALQALEQRPGIDCTGRVQQADVPALLRTARCGLNLVPCQRPFTQQTSTKLLEYCAAGLQVLSTDYPWVRQFAQQHGAHLRYLSVQGPHADLFAVLEQALLQPPALPSGALQPQAWSRVVARMPVWRLWGLAP